MWKTRRISQSCHFRMLICLVIFPTMSVYTNLDYLFWRKNKIEDSKLNKNPYPWILWYLWKARNDKLFRGITRDLLELIRHAKSEYHAWFDANVNTSDETQTVHQTRNIQVLSLQNICLVDVMDC